MTAQFLRALRAATVLLTTATATAATAESVECAYNSWRGTETDSDAIAWVGSGFLADTASAVIQVRVPDGFYDPEQAEVVNSDNFTGFVFYKTEQVDDGSTYRVRYSFRLYSSGKCEGRVDQEGYEPIVASGRVK